MVDSYRFLFFLLFYFLIPENFEKSSIEKTNQTVEKVEVKSWFPLFIFLKFNLTLLATKQSTNQKANEIQIILGFLTTKTENSSTLT